MDVLDSNGELIFTKIPVPCGKCPACLSSRSDEWVVRLSEEVRSAENVTFFTLTYDDLHIPSKILYDDKNDRYKVTNVVDKRDIQLFLKRLRKKLGNGVRYFICSEYGPTTLRPHYHGLLFNVPQHLLRHLDETIFEKWQKGFTSSSPCNPSRVRYVAKYVNSFSSIPDYYPRPFTMCSLRPAIGSAYLERDARIRSHKKTLSTLYIDEQGFYHRLPRYYKRKIFDRLDLARVREKYLEEKSNIVSTSNFSDFFGKHWHNQPWLTSLFDQLKDEEDWQKRRFIENFDKKLKKRKL